MGKNARIEEYHLSLKYIIIFMSLTVHTCITHNYAPNIIQQKLV